MHKLLVTGCRGQLGSELQDIAEDYESLDLLFTDYTELDITDRKAVRMFVEDHGSAATCSTTWRPATWPRPSPRAEVR